MTNKVKRLCVLVGALMFATVSGIATAQDVITVDPFQDEYVIMAGSGIDQSTGKLFYIPVNPDGTFGTPSEVEDLGYRSGAGIANFDNDGDLDFVAGARDNILPVAHFYLFENIGNGEFVKRWIASVDAGPLSDNRVGTFAIADFNGDGLKDFVAPIYRSNHIYLFTNIGDGTFERTMLASLSDPFDAKEGDFNEDGNMDFVVTQYFTGYIWLYAGDGNGGFNPSPLFYIPYRAADITSGDFNEDGHLDIIVDDFIIGGGGGHFFVGDGTGNFIPSGMAYTRPVGGASTYGVDSFDFDKDGHRDLILSSYEFEPTGLVFVMKGNGDGTFQPAVQVASGLGSVFPVTPSEIPVLRLAIDIKPGSYPNSINPKSKGKIPVAILSTEGFDAPEMVDIDSLTFGRRGDEDSLAFCDHKPKNKDKRKDNGKDKVKDLVCHFDTEDTGFLCGDTEGILKGKTKDGTPIEGRDSVRINPCKK